MKNLYKIFFLLPISIKLSALIAILVSILAALVEFATLLLLSSIIQAYTNPNPEFFVDDQILINLSIFDASYGFSPVSLIIFLLVLFFASSFLKGITLHSCLSTGAKIGTFLSSEIYKKILYISYDKFLLSSSSSIINLLTSVTTQSALASNYFLQLITSSIISLIILSSMLTVDLNSSAFLFSSLFIVYVLTASALEKLCLSWPG